jgi:hypothetical protein
MAQAIGRIWSSTAAGHNAYDTVELTVRLDLERLNSGHRMG